MYHFFQVMMCVFCKFLLHAVIMIHLKQQQCRRLAELWKWLIGFAADAATETLKAQCSVIVAPVNQSDAVQCIVQKPSAEVHCIICCCSFVVWCPWSSISRSVSSQYSCSSCRRRLASSPWVSWLQRSLPRYQHHAWYFHCAPFSLTTCDNKSNNHHHRRQNRLHLFIFSVWWLWLCGPKIIINGASSVCKLQLKIQYSISCVTRVSNKLVKDQMRFADTMQPPAVDCREVDLVEVSFGFCCDAVCLINSASSRSSSDVFGSF